MVAPLQEMSRELIRRRLAQFLPQSERPAEPEAAPEDALADDDVSLLESTLRE